MTQRALLLAFLLGVVTAAPLSLLAGYALWHAPKQLTPVGALPGYRQPDGSQVLPLTPHASLPPAPHALPPGATEHRRVQVVVQPSRQAPDVSGDCTNACPPVRLDLSLVDDETGSRVVTSSPDGSVLGGQDLIVPTDAQAAAPRTWVLLQAAPGDTWGAHITRQFRWFGRPLVAGVGVLATPDMGTTPVLSLALPLQ